jgi:hypothetical protein
VIDTNKSMGVTSQSGPEASDAASFKVIRRTRLVVRLTNFASDLLHLAAVGLQYEKLREITIVWNLAR